MKKKFFLALSFVLLSWAVPAMATMQCIDIMTCRLCAFFDDDGNKIADLIICNLPE